MTVGRPVVAVPPAAMMTMIKIDIAAIEAAADGETA